MVRTVGRSLVAGAMGTVHGADVVGNQLLDRAAEQLIGGAAEQVGGLVAHEDDLAAAGRR